MNIGQILANPQEQQKRAIENLLINARCCITGYIVDFNSENQTATIQPTIKENINNENISLPTLLDVPVQFPQSGGFSITFPVKEGDECIVVFSDMCIDSWWQLGGVQAQAEKRRHDLSDGIAILGIRSIPNVISNFANDTMQMRNKEGSTFIEISEDTIKIKAKNLIMEVEDNTAITSNLNVDKNISGGGATLKDGVIKSANAVIGSIDFVNHIHGGVVKGEDKTKIPEE